MSDSAPEDILTDEQAMALGDTKLREILSGGGTVTKHVRCSKCGNTSPFSYEAADPGMIVKIMEFMQKRKTAGTEGVHTRAKLTLDWFREASDEDLAREFHAEP